MIERKRDTERQEGSEKKKTKPHRKAWGEGSEREEGEKGERMREISNTVDFPRIYSIVMGFFYLKYITFQLLFSL